MKNRKKLLIILMVILAMMSLATYTGVTTSLFTDDEQSTEDALNIRWGLFTLNDSFEGTPWDDYWNENGTTTWVQDSAKPHTGTYNAYSNLSSNGYLTSDEIDASTADNITVSFWFNLKMTEAGDSLVQTYNGTAYNTWYDLTAYPTYVNNTWCEFNEMITDPQYLIAGFRVRFDTTSLVDTNEDANIDDVVITTDTIPPSAPTGLAATAGNEEISLDWNDNTEDDLWGYNVYRSLTTGDNYTQINTSLVSTSDYIDTGLYGGGTYYYVVTAVDTGSNESGYSGESSDTAIDVAPAAPTGLAATPDEFEVSLEWDDNTESDFDSYNVYRSLSSGSGYSQISDNVSTSNYTDLGLTNGTTYYYVVTAVDVGTYESGNSGEASATPVDIPPAAPTGLAATPGEFEIELGWDDNTEIDLEGYNVYRSLTTGSGYSQISDNVSTSNYTDTGLINGTTYYYVVTAVDVGTNESDNSSEVSTAPVNVPPAAPTGLTAIPDEFEVTLNWDDNTESDLEGYDVYRSLTSGSGYSQISDNVSTSDYTDSGLTNGTTYYYVVKAVDAESAESDYSGEASATPLDVAPSPPTGLGTTAGDEEVTLDWNDNLEIDIDGYNVYRSLTSGSGYAQINGSLVSSSGYTDLGLTNGTTYYYVVTAVDVGTNESGLSNEASALPTNAPPAAPTGLGATPGNAEAILDWNDNTEPDLAGYNVYRSLTSGDNYTQINGPLVSTSNYTDTGLANGTTYYYVVTAVDTYSAESGSSGEASATPVAPDMLIDGFEDTPWDAKWNANGTTTWILDSATPHGGIYNAFISDAQTPGALTSDDIDASASVNITVNFWFNPKGLEAGDIIVKIYNGSTYNTWYDLTSYPTYNNNTWCEFQEIISDSQYFISNFRIQFDASALGGAPEELNIDDVMIMTDSIPPAAPTGLGATPGNTTAELDWNDNTDMDLDGYNVYRSLTSGSGYAQINGSLVSTSNYTDTSLTNGTTYYYVVTAVDMGNNESGSSNEASATPVDLPPAAPTGLGATPGNTTAELDWNDNLEGDLDGYNVYRSLTSGSGYSQINGPLVSTSNYTDSDLTNGTTYYYVVTAVDVGTNESDQSSEVSATPVDLPPAPPTGLGATPGNTEVELGWDDNLEGDLDGYNVYRSTTSGSGYAQINGSLVSTSNYTDTGLTNGTTYYYVVTAVDVGTNESDQSSEASATPVDPPPAAPTGLGATPGNTTVELNWDDNTEEDLDSYNVYRSLTSGSGYSMISDNVSTSDYTDTGLTNGTTYYYVVTAVDLGSNESDQSDEASATPVDPPPAAPTGLGATPGNTTVDLNWNDNLEGDLDSYNVYRSLTSGSGYSLISDNVSTSAYTDTGLTNGTTYYYVVTAVDLGSNESDQSDEASATPYAPQTLLDDSFEGSPWNANWDGNGTTTWVLDSGKAHTGTYNARLSNKQIGGPLTSDDLNAAGASWTTVTFWFNPKGLEAGDIIVKIYNGSTYNTWYDLTSYPTYTNNAWCSFSETITDSQYLISNFRLQFDGSVLGDSTEEINIDDVLVTTNQ